MEGHSGERIDCPGRHGHLGMAAFDPIVRDVLAREVHNDYLRRSQENEGPLAKRPETVQWDDLSEEFKEANRRQVDDIEAKLARIGARIVTAAGTPSAFDFSAEEIELLARHEHDRWIKERRGQGWQLGTTRDSSTKTTPCLVPYDELSEKEREKDRDTVRRIPRLLALAGLEIVRDTE